MANITIDLGTFNLNSTNSIAVADINYKVAKSLSQKQLVKEDGSVIPIARRKSISVPVKGKIKGSDYTDLRGKIDALLAALEASGEQKLTLDDERYIMAQYSGVSVSWVHFRTLASFSFTMTASDPFWYSETLTTDTENPTTAVGYTINNPGNAKSRAKVTITNNSGSGITDDIKLENVTQNEVFEFEGTIANTKALVVNNRMDQQTITILNDGVRANGSFYGVPITLAPGDNTFKLTSGGAPNVEVKVEFRPAYL